MEAKINVTEETRLADILAAYPWLPDALIRLDDRFKAVKSPLVQALIRRATVADAAKRTGYAAEDIIKMLNDLVALREE